MRGRLCLFYAGVLEWFTHCCLRNSPSRAALQVHQIAANPVQLTKPHDMRMLTWQAVATLGSAWHLHAQSDQCLVPGCGVAGRFVQFNGRDNFLTASDTLYMHAIGPPFSFISWYYQQVLCSVNQLCSIPTFSEWDFVHCMPHAFQSCACSRMEAYAWIRFIQGLVCTNLGSICSISLACVDFKVGDAWLAEYWQRWCSIIESLMIDSWARMSISQ